MKLSLKDPEKFVELIALNGKTIGSFARSISSSPSYIGKIVRGDVYPEPRLAQKIVDGLSASKKHKIQINDIFLLLALAKR